jgi:metacaspase-1
MAKYALCIGINDYPGTGSDLAGCVNDAQDWAKMFQQRGFAVSTLFDGKATGRSMRAAIAGTIAKAKSGDVVAIHYSGHGTFVDGLDGDEPDGTDECLCPHDIKANGPLKDDELQQLYGARADGVKLVMFSDSCHSGSVAKFAPITTPPTMLGKAAPVRKVRFLPPQAYMSARDSAKLGRKRAMRSSSPPGRNEALLMSGCQDVEYSYDAWFQGRPNGAFTFVALRELAKLNGSATYAGWHVKIRKALPSQQYPQSPNLYGPSSMRDWRILA